MRLLVITFLVMASCAQGQVKKPKASTTAVQKEAQMYYRFGYDYLVARNYPDAIKNFKIAIDKDPEYYDAYIGLGQAYRGSKDLVAAESIFHKALKLDPQNPKAYDGLAGIYVDQWNPSEAISYYNQAIGVDSTYAGAHKGLGNVYERLKQYDQAQSEYEKYMQLKPDDVGAIFKWAALKVKMGKCAEAIDKLEGLKQKFPKDLKLRKTIGDAYYDLKMYNKAVGEYKYILSEKPDNRIILLKLGDAYSELKKYRLAETNYKKAAELDTTDKVTFLKLSALYISTRRYSAARKTLTKVMKIDPANSYASLLMGDLYKVYGIMNKNARKLKSAKSNWRTAITYYQKAARDSQFKIYANNEIKRCKVYIAKVSDEIWWKKQKGG